MGMVWEPLAVNHNYIPSRGKFPAEVDFLCAVKLVLVSPFLQTILQFEFAETKRALSHTAPTIRARARKSKRWLGIGC
jgi:hypothetical protein